MNLKKVILVMAVLFCISYFYNKSNGRDIVAEMKQAAAEGWEEGWNGEINSGAGEVQQNSEPATTSPHQSQNVNKGMSDEEYMSKPITARICLDEYIRRNKVPVISFYERNRFDEIFQNALNSMNQYEVPIYFPGMPDQEAKARYETAFVDNDKKGFPIRMSRNKYEIGTPDTWDSCNFLFYGKPDSTKGGDKLEGDGVLFEYTNIGSYKFFRVVYIGEFEDGRYNGYGQAYYAPDSYNTYDKYILDSYGDRLQEGVYEAMNYLEYEGKFKNGKYNGKGNRYEYLDSESRYMVMFAQQPNFNPEDYDIPAEGFDEKFNQVQKLTREVVVYTGSFSDGYDDNVKLYVNGQETDPEDFQ